MTNRRRSRILSPSNWAEPTTLIMTRSIEDIAGMTELPIFPLPLVMVPGEVLPLHIFESRYRQMLTDIGGVGGVFGIRFADPEAPSDAAALAGSVGCAAEIIEAQTMDDGRSNIVTIGIGRYRLLGLIDDDKPYLVGDVAFFRDEPDDGTEAADLADEVYGLFERMAGVVSKMQGGRNNLPELNRSDPETLSFVLSAALNFPNELKSRFLEMTSTGERLSGIRMVLAETVEQLEANSEILAAAKTNGHSNKKLDL